MNKLFNVQEWYQNTAGINRHISTLAWQKSWCVARAIKRTAEIDKKYPKGTYFKLV